MNKFTFYKRIDILPRCKWKCVWAKEKKILEVDDFLSLTGLGVMA